jgi:hypothetical protein|tara:strand:- start:943 stop:1116 length:174 start_codon:yes stop_codon:yes gene_type:complete
VSLNTQFPDELLDSILEDPTYLEELKSGVFARIERNLGDKEKMKKIGNEIFWCEPRC